MPEVEEVGTVAKSGRRTPSGAVTGEALVQFISGAMTNIGRGTYYNLPEEQQQAMKDMHSAILKSARPFYTLMTLPAGVNDVNKQLITFSLVENTLRESGLKDGERSPTTMWENEVMLQALGNMQPNRVFDLFSMFAEKSMSPKRLDWMFHEYMKRHKDRWGLWAIKYRKPMTVVLRHFHSAVRGSKADALMKKIWRYLKYNEADASLPEIIHDYVAVQNGNKDSLAKLPVTVAEGFMQKFELNVEQFHALFKEKGGRFTAKEKKLKATSVKKAGSDTGLDINRLELFDYLVFLKSLIDSGEDLPESSHKLRGLIAKKGKALAAKMPIEFEKVAIIFDNSISMYGSGDQKFHPYLRAMAISSVIQGLSGSSKEYFTNPGDNLIKGIFPQVGSHSNYATPIMQALKDGHKTIMILGDGYENAPYEGAAHQLLFAYKQKIDSDLTVMHFNPVFASESLDARGISQLASNVGVRDVSALGESMVLALAKQDPIAAISAYVKNLVALQGDEAKSLMPQSVADSISQGKLLVSNQ
ncbi:MAG: hypothetical protein KAS32_26840 [Candidatus Peribacteraceae bacterium]|nr:hypothetical protein [Candidatus Peribacteraceae bacterium]